MLRIFLAAVAAWAAWGLVDASIYAGLTSALPEAFDADGHPAAAGMLAALIVLRLLYSVGGGALAARIGGGRAATAAKAAAGLLLLTGVVVQALTWDAYPLWYHVGFLALIAPAALLGGRLGRRGPAAGRGAALSGG